MPDVIIDANVMVSGAGDLRGTPPVAVVNAVVDGVVRLVVSTALLAEYRRVLSRPKLRRVHGLDAAGIDAFLWLVDDRAQLVVAPATDVAAPDPGDQHLWDLLAAAPEAILVTGDRKLLESSDFPGRILSPREFVERYGLTG
jgi:putative PIN family toxin of toxin-antitoxin system